MVCCSWPLNIWWTSNTVIYEAPSLFWLSLKWWTQSGIKCDQSFREYFPEWINPCALPASSHRESGIVRLLLYWDLKLTGMSMRACLTPADCNSAAKINGWITFYVHLEPYFVSWGRRHLHFLRVSIVHFSFLDCRHTFTFIFLLLLYLK